MTSANADCTADRNYASRCEVLGAGVFFQVS